MSDSFQGSSFRSLGLAPISSGAATVERLDVTINGQEHDEWCWAAVAVTVSNYFRGRLNPRQPAEWNQCDVVKKIRNLDRLSCDDPELDKPGDLRDALIKTRNLAMTKLGFDSSVIQDIQAEIIAKRPVGVRVAWDRGGAHVCLITGFSATGFHIEDPALDQSEMPFTIGFLEYQRQSSTCTHLYFTRQVP